MITALARGRARAADQNIAFLRWRRATAAAVVVAAPHHPKEKFADDNTGGMGSGGSGGGGGGDLCTVSPGWTVGATGTGTGVVEALKGELEMARLGTETLAKQHAAVLEDSRCLGARGRGGGGVVGKG